jgi:hypothetical protein
MLASGRLGREEPFRLACVCRGTTQVSEDKAMVTQTGGLAMQVCVPRTWTDAQVIIFAEEMNPCGTEHGWAIRREGSDLLRGAKERAQCSHRPESVHIMLDA